MWSTAMVRPSLPIDGDSSTVEDEPMVEATVLPWMSKMATVRPWMRRGWPVQRQCSRDGRRHQSE